MGSGTSSLREMKPDPMPWPRTSRDAGPYRRTGFIGSTEQVGVRAGADKGEASIVVGDGVDQEPIGLEVTVAEAPEVAEQRMVPISGRQGLTSAEEVNGFTELGQVLAASPHPLDILAEAAGV